MCFHLYNSATSCFARTSGEVLARVAGMPSISFINLARHRGVVWLYS